MGSKTCKRCDHLSCRNISDAVGGFDKYLIQPISCCICSFFIFNILCSWTNQQISMNSRRNQNTFAKFSRECKNCMTHMAAHTFVKETVFTFTWYNMNFLFADHIMKTISIDSSCINNTFCFISTTGCFNFPVLCTRRNL